MLLLHGDRYQVVELNTSRWSILVAQSALNTGWLLRVLSADLTKYVLIAFPFVLLPIWLAVSRGLRPLRQLSERIARRSPEDLTPLRIEPRYEELKPLVAALDTLLAQLLRLVDNAIRYGREGGRIAVDRRRAEGFLILAVSDDGPGIAESERTRVFDRFYRGPTQTRPGAGLGLTIVKHAAARMGGEVRLSSGPDGRGCRFEARVPEVPGRRQAGAPPALVAL